MSRTKARTLEWQVERRSLVGTTRRKIQLELAFSSKAEGEAQGFEGAGTEGLTSRADFASQAVAFGPCMEDIVERNNLKKALAQVKRNKGAPGVDAMSVDDLASYLKDHWPAIKAQLVDGTYEPQPVRRVEMRQRSDGGSICSHLGFAVRGCAAANVPGYGGPR
jgi:RNA-directed DNA polymerase